MGQQTSGEGIQMGMVNRGFIVEEVAILVPIALESSAESMTIWPMLLISADSLYRVSEVRMVKTEQLIDN